jgi:hypothetical protein
MTHSLPIVMAALLLLFLGACAATPYQPMRGGEGYAEQRIESNRYRVSFAGNSSTPRETVQDYVLYRAAELTLANGYDYFVLGEQSTVGEPGGSSGLSFGFGGFSFGSGGGVGVGVGTSTGGGSAQYMGQANILMFKGRKPDDNAKAFDARAVKANLDAQIRRPEEKSPAG